MISKAVAKRVIAAAALRLPWGAQRAVFDALCDGMVPGEALTRAAAKAGITGFSAPGQWGVVQSAATDRKVLLTYAQTGDWARRSHEVFERFFAEDGGTFLDLGANIGLTTLPVARNPCVQCFAFEPDPTNYANLDANIRRNAVHGNVRTFNLALLDRRGFVPFGLAEEGNLGDHRVMAPGSPQSTMQVEAAPLDELDLPIKGRLGVNMDTQGAEPAIIVGGRAILKQVSLMVLEFQPYLIAQLGGDPDEVIQYISGFDRVAVLPGESEGDLVYNTADKACETMREVYKAAKDDVFTYVDVYAERSV